MWKALNFRKEIQPFQEIYFQTNSSASLAVGSNETGTGSPPAVGRQSRMDHTVEYDRSPSTATRMSEHISEHWINLQTTAIL